MAESCSEVTEVVKVLANKSTVDIGKNIRQMNATQVLLTDGILLTICFRFHVLRHNSLVFHEVGDSLL